MSGGILLIDFIFQNISTDQFAIIMLAMFLGGFCKGVIGVALPLVGISVMVALIDAKLAVAMIVIPIVVTNFQMAFRSGWTELKDVLLRFWPLVATCFISLLIVAMFATRLSSSEILVGLGIALMVFVLASVSRWKPSISPPMEKPVGAFAGVLAGILGGATSVYGPPITMYLLACDVPKSKWSASVGATFAVGSISLVLGYTLNGNITPAVAVVSGLSCVPAFLGMWLGFKLQDAMDPATFRKILMAGLFLMALNLVRKGMFG